MKPEEIASVDEALQIWRQGDVVLGDALPAIHIANLSVPGTPESEQLSAEQAAAGEALGLEVVTQDFPGFMIVSQTCDIVRSCATREYVELCPLIEVPQEKLAQVRAGRMPRYLWCSGLTDQALAADLDHVSTVEKRTLIQFNDQRIAGVNAEEERRRLASALARKRARAALPDEFVSFIEPLQRRVKDRHGRNSDEGRFLAAMREMRAVPEPDWGAAQTSVTLLFLFDDAAQIPSNAEAQMDALIQRVTPCAQFTLDGRIITMEQITAAAYLSSDALDLDALSDG